MLLGKLENSCTIDIDLRSNDHLMCLGVNI